jgi:hypothetical protein
MDFGFRVPLKIYVTLITTIFIIFFAWEEIHSPTTYTSKYIKKLLGHHDLHDFLAWQSREM